MSLDNKEGTSESGNKEERPPPPRTEKPRVKEVIGWKEIDPAIEGGEESARHFIILLSSSGSHEAAKRKSAVAPSGLTDPPIPAGAPPPTRCDFFPSANDNLQTS